MANPAGERSSEMEHLKKKVSCGRYETMFSLLDIDVDYFNDV